MGNIHNVLIWWILSVIGCHGSDDDSRGIESQYELVHNFLRTEVVRGMNQEPQSLATVQSICYMTNKPLAPVMRDAFIDRELHKSIENPGFRQQKFTNVQALTANIIQNLETTAPQPQMYLITGIATSGKSTIVTKMQYDILTALPNHWAIFVDLSAITQRITEYTSTQLWEQIIEAFQQPQRVLVIDLLKTDPSQLIFTIDSTEQFPNCAAVADLIKTYIPRSTIILTGDMDTSSLLRHHGLSFNSWRIPDMNFLEVKKHLINSLGKHVAHFVPKPDSLIEELTSQRIDIFASVYARKLLATPIPRHVQSLTFFNEMFLEEDSSKHEFRLILLLTDLETTLSLAPLEEFRASKYLLFQKLVGCMHLHPDETGLFEIVAMRDMIIGTPIEENVKANILQLIDGPHASQNEYEQILSIARDKLKSLFHHDFQSFFAAEYVMKFCFINRDVMKEVVTHERFVKLLEFIETSSYPINEITKNLALFGLMDAVILDNFLAHGFRKLFTSLVTDCLESDSSGSYRAILRTYIESDKFIAKYIKPVNRIFGMIELSLTGRGGPALSRLRQLVRYEMLEVYRLLYTEKIKYPRRYYDKLLQHTVSMPQPSVNFLQELINTRNIFVLSAPTALSVYGTLLRHTIDMVGEPCIPLAKSLAESIKPSYFTQPKAQGLLIAAARWNSVALMKLVLDDFQVPIVDESLVVRVLATILDANPTPLHTPLGWWETLHFFLERVTATAPLSEGIVRSVIGYKQRDYKDDLPSLWIKWFKFMVGGHRKARKVRPLAPNDNKLKSNSDLMYATPSAKWGLDKGMLALRRLSIGGQLKNNREPISLLEVLSHYRGVMPLEVSARISYELVITSLIELEGPSIPKAAKLRIACTFVDNVSERLDLENLDHFLYKHLLDGMDGLKKMVRSKAKGRVRASQKGRQADKDLIIRLMTVEQRLLQSRVEFDPKIVGHPDELPLATHEPQPSTSTGVTSCLSPRVRRGLFICHFSWDDVDQFNDGPRGQLRGIMPNSDRFLRSLAHVELSALAKARQLVELVRYLSDGGNEITGESHMYLKKVLTHGSLASYQRYQRKTSTIHEILAKSPGTELGVQLPSKSFVIHGATAFLLVKGFYSTIQTCLAQRNDSSCVYAGSALALSAALPVVGHQAFKHMPTVINSFGNIAHELLPSWTPKFIRSHINTVQNLALRHGAKVLTGILAAPGVGFDIYNIIQTSKTINACFQNADGCPSRDRIEAIISLTFSCASIGVTAISLIPGVGPVVGVLLGVALVVLESIALGINDVVYYHNNYQTTLGEDARIFFDKIFLRQLPNDVEALVNRTDWVRALGKRTNAVLDRSNGDVAAYAVGIGSVNDVQTSASYSFINMADFDVENSKGLSRVLPTAKDGHICVCLPKQDEDEEYEKYSNSVPDANFACRNSFVIAKKDRWNNPTRASSIIYNLEHTRNGVIIGSRGFNNIFYIFESTTMLLVTGSGDRIDKYQIMTDSFTGTIVLSEVCQTSIIEFLTVPSEVKFSWDAALNMGQVTFGNRRADSFTVRARRDNVYNMFITGRPHEPDSFTCDWSNIPRHRFPNTAIMRVDGGGGRSVSKMDWINDCELVVVRPFTHVIGSSSVEAMYRPSVWLDGAAGQVKDAIGSVATIWPLNSTFMITFANRPLLLNTIDVKYDPTTRILTWSLLYTQASSLKLSIVPYHSEISEQTNVADNIASAPVTSIFVDSYQGTSVVPVVRLALDKVSPVTIEQFNVFKIINSSRLEEVLNLYHEFKALQGTLVVSTKFIDPGLNQSFMFGSEGVDHCLIDTTAIFVAGCNGKDTYSLSGWNHELWIDNEADDDALDTLIIPDGLCHSLDPRIRSEDSSCCDGFQHDVTLNCQTNSSNYRIVLRSYLLDARHQHLRIHWRDSFHMVIPEEWVQGVTSNGPTLGRLRVALFFDFNEQWESPILELLSSSEFVVLRGISKDNPLVIYRSGTDVHVSRKYLEITISLFMKNFFEVDRPQMVAKNWRKFKIVVIDDDIGKVTLTIDDILNLVIISGTEPDAIQEYNVSLDQEVNKTITIDHNNSTDNRIGILTIRGGKPKDFRCSVSDDATNITSLMLHTNHSRVYIKNWCISKFHRLHRIEFLQSSLRPSIVIRDVDLVECDQLDTLNDMLTEAQEQLLMLMKEPIENDQSLLIKCYGSLLVDTIVKELRYRFFFASLLEQINFIRDYCHPLFSQYTPNITLLDMIDTIKRRSRVFLNNRDVSQEDKESVERLNSRLGELDDNCWQKFVFTLNNNYTISPKDNDFSKDGIYSIISQCIPDIYLITV